MLKASLDKKYFSTPHDFWNEIMNEYIEMK